MPIYQRKYSWSIPQCKKLLQDVLVAGKDDESFGHFTGSIVYITKDVFHAAVINQLSIIDGQQRLTTLSLMILALRNALEIQKKEIGISTRKLTNYYVVNSDEEDDLYYKLVLTDGDNQAIRSILDSDKAAIDAYKESRIVQNYNYFFNEMMKSELKVVYEGLKKLMIIDVSLEQGKDNPQLIFESLNSTGLDLSQSDLIRNYILMDLDPKLQSTMYRKYWLKIEQLNEKWKEILGQDWKTIHTQYLNRLGNLTLTRYNSELSNQEFEGKRKMKNGFIYSPIRLNRMLAEVEQWDPSAIDRRGNLLSRRTLNIWQYPSVSPDYCEQREETVDNVSYTIEDYEFRSKPNLELFTSIQDYLINLNAGITVKYNKHYVVFRFRSNLTSVMFTKEGISVNINASVDELTDPKGLLRDLRGIGHWATGESEIKIFSPAQLDDVYQLIHQAYAIQMEI